MSRFRSFGKIWDYKNWKLAVAKKMVTGRRGFILVECKCFGYGLGSTLHGPALFAGIFRLPYLQITKSGYCALARKAVTGRRNFIFCLLFGDNPFAYNKKCIGLFSPFCRIWISPHLGIRKSGDRAAANNMVKGRRGLSFLLTISFQLVVGIDFACFLYYTNLGYCKI